MFRGVNPSLLFALASIPGVFSKNSTTSVCPPCNIYLHILQGGHTEVVELLLNTPGIDANAKSNDGLTPLNMTACLCKL